MNQKNIFKYDKIIYDHFKIQDLSKKLKITYYFEIPNLEKFEPTLEIPKLEEKEITPFIEELVFHIGLVELISYWKCCCPKKLEIRCGYLNEEQKAWFQKLYFYGLEEFFYTNHLNPDPKKFIDIITSGEKRNLSREYKGVGCMIAVGGGKDSCVSLELLKKEENCSAFIINPKPVMLKCVKTSGIKEENIMKINRTISPKIIELNNKGFLNGHTPFSAMVAFVSYLTAYLNNKKYIILSNESSANESNIKDTKINHQYSKSFEFESDFIFYTNKYFGIDIHYFSLLRPLSEFQIGMLFSKMPQYHQIFKSCNPGSKKEEWQWCGTCPKCLFVFSLLSPFLYREKLIEIFGSDLFEKKELLPIFKELLGFSTNKPFDCVGTYEEINYAIHKTIDNQNQLLPYLLQYYKEHYYNHSNQNLNLEKSFNTEHFLNKHYENIIRKALSND